jgi:hypothetical protein
MKCSTSLAVKEMQIKTMTETIFLHSEWQSSTRQTRRNLVKNAGRGADGKFTHHCWEGKVTFSTMEICMEGLQKTKNIYHMILLYHSFHMP